MVAIHNKAITGLCLAHLWKVWISGGWYLIWMLVNYQSLVAFGKLQCLLYHSYQDCPIDLNILHCELFYDHEIVPHEMASCALCVRLHNTHVYLPTFEFQKRNIVGRGSRGNEAPRVSTFLKPYDPVFSGYISTIVQIFESICNIIYLQWDEGGGSGCS